jgi:hypothetical protein
VEIAVQPGAVFGGADVNRDLLQDCGCMRAGGLSFARAQPLWYDFRGRSAIWSAFSRSACAVCAYRPRRNADHGSESLLRANGGRRDRLRHDRGARQRKDIEQFSFAEQVIIARNDVLTALLAMEP